MNITVTKRNNQSKGERRRRLRQGHIPGAVYGRGLDPFLVEVPVKAVADVLLAESGMNTMIDLTVEGDKKKLTVIVDNLERHPITRNFLHIGFHALKKGDKVTAQVPVLLVGTPSDVTLNGALLEQTLETIDVHAEPADLPPHLEVDVSGLKIGDVLRVADLAHNLKLDFVTPEDAAIASVHVSTTAQQLVDADAAVEESALSGTDAVTELRADADRKSDSVTGTAE